MMLLTTLPAMKASPANGTFASMSQMVGGW
jgi:hypothetical protein